MHTTSRIAQAAALAAAALMGASLVVAPASHATPGDVLAQDAPSSSKVVAAGPRVTASLPRGLVISGHDRNGIALFAKGQPIIRRVPSSTAPARFTGLKTGAVYVAFVGGVRVAAVRVLDRPSPASGLLVRATDHTDSVELAWRHTPTTSTGGSAVRYDVVARPAHGAPVRTQVLGKRSLTLDGLDPKAVYTFSVTPRNSAGSGRATTARMTRPLAAVTTDKGSTAADPEPSPTPAQPISPAAPAAPEPLAEPAAPSAPAPAPAPARPSTRTIYVCPDGFSDAGTNCRRTQGYTYTTTSYTYHQEQTGTKPTYTSTCDAVRTVWKEGSWQVEHYSYPCTKGGEPIYQDVKDPTPAGWEDTGTGWRKKDPAPAGYSDDGSQYVQTAEKIAQVVPA